MKSQEQILFEILEPLQRLLEFAKDPVSEMADYKQLLSEISELVAEKSQIDTDAGLSNIAKALSQWLELHGDVGESLDEQKLQELQKGYDEIRMQTTFSLMGTYKSIMASQGGYKDIFHDSEGKIHGVSSINKVKGDIVFTSIGVQNIILLPKLLEDTDIEFIKDVLSGLLQIYEHSHKSFNWIVDFSNVENLPLLLVGTLIGYKQEIRKRGKTLLCSWLRDGSLPEDTMKTATHIFHLTQIGGYWFSKDTE